MGSLGPTQLIALLLAVAIVAATGGFVASAIARTNKRRTHRLFLLGFVCGLTAGAVLRGRRRSLHAWRPLDGRADLRPLAAHALTFAASHARLGLRLPQWHRQPRMYATPTPGSPGKSAKVAADNEPPPDRASTVEAGCRTQRADESPHRLRHVVVSSASLRQHRHPLVAPRRAPHKFR